MSRGAVQVDLPLSLSAPVVQGAEVRLADGRSGFVKRVSTKGVIELATAAGSFLCISHVDCVRAVLTACTGRAARAPARSAAEDGRARRLGNPALNPDSFQVGGRRG